MLDEWEVEHLEDVTERLHGMCIEAAHHLVTGTYGTLGLPPRVLELARESLDTDPVSVYGRFDLRYDGEGPAQLYEYNADTPTGLIESSVAQWYWLQDMHPERDQWNSLHERLVAAWRKNASRIGPVLHLAHSEVETSGEEWMTVAYLRDTADQAGLNTVGMTMEQIGFDHDRRRFVDHEGRVISSLLQALPVGGHARRRVRRPGPGRPRRRPAGSSRCGRCCCPTRRCWRRSGRLYPGHENLLPAYLDRPWGMDVLHRQAAARPGGRRDALDAGRHRARVPGAALRRRGLLLPALGAAAVLRRRPSGASAAGSSTAMPPGSASASRTGRSPTTGPASCRTTSTRRRPARTSGRRGSRRTGSSPSIPGPCGRTCSTRSSTSAVGIALLILAAFVVDLLTPGRLVTHVVELLQLRPRAGGRPDRPGAGHLHRDLDERRVRLR